MNAKSKTLLATGITTYENKTNENGANTEGHKMDTCCCGSKTDQTENETQKEGIIIVR